MEEINSMKTHYQILVIGGGTGGIMAAANLLKKDSNLDIGIVEPADTHYYQPAWTLVGANAYNYEKTARPMSGVIPNGADWIKDYAASFDPENNSISLKDGTDISYDFLIVAPGLVMKPELVPGLPEVIGKGVVCSIYTNPEHTWKVLQDFKGGTALFTQPTTPIKCGGAPQKIMYLADDYFNKAGKIASTDVIYATPGSVIFGVPEIKKTLMNVIDRKVINLRLGRQLVKIDGENQIAWYKLADHASVHNEGNVKMKKDGELEGIPYDMMHLAPPQGPPEFVANSALANEGGWLSVDQYTMQHTKYENIFGLGDVCALPTAKTGAAIRKQVPVVVENVLRLKKAQSLGSKKYNGYSSCPLVTGYGKMVLAEFDYDNKFTPDPKLKQMLIFDSSKEHWRLWMLKKYMLPYLYWNKMLKGIEV